MYIGSGPFTADMDLEFKPWNIFMQAVRRAKPDVLVLVGRLIIRQRDFFLQLFLRWDLLWTVYTL